MAAPGALQTTVKQGAAPASRSLTALALRRFLRHRLALTGSAILLALMLASLLAPWIAPHDPEAMGVTFPTWADSILQPPSAAHPFGTDELGRDTLSRIIYGAQVSLSIGFAVALLSTLIGVIFGLVSGFVGGFVDAVIVATINFVIAVPTLPFILVLQGLLRDPRVPLSGYMDQVFGLYASAVMVVFVLVLFGWTTTARLVRGQVLALREREFVEAARALGAPRMRILGRHLLPNSLAPVIVEATITVGQAVLVEAALSFLGFGVQGVPTWGRMLSTADSFLLREHGFWLAFFPGMAILVTVLSIQFVGDGLRDAFDPRSTK